MLIVCKCLNVSIDASDDPSEDVDMSSLNLSQEEESNSLFKEKLKRIELNKVTVQVKSLMQSKAIGCWMIERCTNCSTDCYTTHTDRSLTLANTSLVTHPDVISKMRTYKDYSPIFRIVVEPLILDNIANQSDSRESPQNVQTALTSLQQQVNEIIREQVTKTEEIIRQFTEQQYALLEEFRERATKDHKALAQKVYEAQPRPDSNPICSAAGDTSVDPVGACAPKKVLNRRKQDTNPQDSSQLQNRSVSNLTGRNSASATNSLDSEGLFVLEGMEDSVVMEPGHSEEDSDTDHDDSGSHDEGIDVHRKRTSSIHLAKSLPVNVPVYSVPSTDFDNDDEECRGTVDIAASIKALARSVHGDAIFGDLPRPRFSTQI